MNLIITQICNFQLPLKRHLKFWGNFIMSSFNRPLDYFCKILQSWTRHVLITLSVSKMLQYTLGTKLLTK